MPARPDAGRAASSPPTTIIVGTGYVGSRVLESLPDGEAIGLSRTPATGSKPRIEFDLDGEEPLPPLPDHYRLLYTIPPATDAETDVRLQRLLAGLRPLPLVFVYIGTTGVYGDCGGALVDEQTELRPLTARSRRRVAAEQALQAWSEPNEVRLCILRAPGIYGPGRLGLERIRTAAAVIRESEANPGNRIHVDDLASCCIAALLDDRVSGIFNVGDGDHRSAGWFAREVARQAGLGPPPAISRAQAEKEWSPRRLSFLRESRRIDTRRMREELGVTPRYSNAEDGIRASLAST